jgi:hypothetical protein
MAENSLKAFLDMVRRELSWAPVAIFMKSSADGTAFQDLDEARDWSVAHEEEIFRIDNSDYCFAHGDFGWVIIAIEINCWGALNSLIGKGIDEIVSKEEYAERRSGSAKLTVQELFRKTYPSDIQTQVHIDDEQDCDFRGLREAVAYTQQHSIRGYVYFAETPRGRWVILETIDHSFAALGQMILAENGFKCVSFGNAIRDLDAGSRG